MASRDRGHVGRAVVRPAATSPPCDHLALLEAIDQCVAAERALEAAPDDQCEKVAARFNEALERVDELATKLPNPPRSEADIVLRAQVAFCHADKDVHGRLAALWKDEVGDDELAAARLIEAVLQSAGISYY